MSDITFYTMSGGTGPINILIVEGYNHTMDMSVSNTYNTIRLITYDELSTLDTIEEGVMDDCGVTHVVNITPDSVTLEWKGEHYEVKLGETVTTCSYLLDNPHLSVDEVYMKYEYSKVEPWEMMTDLHDYIIKIHRKHPSSIDNTNKYKLMLFKLMESEINHGEIGIYPLYALYRAAENWSTYEITDYDTFSKIMLEGIEKGCFDNYYESGIVNFEQIIEHNPLELLYAHVPQLKEIIISLAQDGVEVAQDICDGRIRTIEKTSRKNPNRKEMLLTIEAQLYNNHNNIGEKIIKANEKKNNGPSEDYIDEEWEMLFGNELAYIELDSFKIIKKEFSVMTQAELVDGNVLLLGDFGEITIDRWEDNELVVSWQGKEYVIKEGYGCKTTSDLVLVDENLPDRFMQVSFNLHEWNVWQKVRNMIGLIVHAQVSSDPRNKLIIESQKAATLKLIDLLMEREGEDLEELREILVENENWKIVDFNGERHDLIE